MAEIRPNYDTERQRLADIIPLAHPFTIYIEQTKYCNFKCYYCMHSVHDNENGVFRRKGHVMRHMDFSLYQNLIVQLKELGIKRIVFSGLGEPLMNPEFPEFTRYAVESGIAERVEVLTNGALLTPQYSDALIKAGITHINVSVQGVTTKTYEQVCGVKLDFRKFVENLSYLYNNRNKTKIYIKSIDAVLPDEADKQMFFEIFSPVADRIYIEHLVVMQQSMDNLHEIVDGSRNLYGEKICADRQVCSQCFYFLQAGVDGNIYPCSIPGLAADFAIGNINNNTLTEIWNGEKRKNHLRTMLEFRKDILSECRHCNCFNSISDPLEHLDDDAERLVKYFK